MYIQDLFREDRIDELHRFIGAFSLGTLIVSTPSVQAQPLPMEVTGDGLGVLRSHFSKQNPLWKTAPDGSEALAIFNGPNAYISPRWYVNGQRSGRVAPSWNYMTVHARGSIKFIDDEEWLRGHLTSLTHAQESNQSNPWKIADAPADFIGDLLHHLVGIEIVLTAIEGKYFLSQHRTAADRQSLVQYLRMQPRGSASDVAAQIENRERKASA